MTKSSERICPLCKKPYVEPPALSRADNRTEICPDCGIREALSAFGMKTAEQESVVKAIREQDKSV